jgi:hypothetical protein
MAPAAIPETLDELTPSWLTDALRAAGVLDRARVAGVGCERLGVDWGSGAGAARRDVTIRRKLRRLAAVDPDDLNEEIA